MSDISQLKQRNLLPRSRSGWDHVDSESQVWCCFLGQVSFRFCYRPCRTQEMTVALACVLTQPWKLLRKDPRPGKVS